MEKTGKDGERDKKRESMYIWGIHREHTCAYTCICTCIHTCMYTYMYPPCMYTCMYVYTYTYIPVYAHGYIYVYMHVCIHVYIHTCICTYIHTCILLLHIHGRRRSDVKQSQLPKFETSFHGSPCNFASSFHGSHQDFKERFMGVNGSPCPSKDPKSGLENCSIWRSKYLRSDLLRGWMLQETSDVQILSNRLSNRYLHKICYSIVYITCLFE